MMHFLKNTNLGKIAQINNRNFVKTNESTYSQKVHYDSSVYSFIHTISCNTETK